MSHPIPRSAEHDIVWPVVAQGQAARLLALQYQFRQSERWSPDKLRAHQFKQLQHIVAHSARTMPFWRQRLRDADIDPTAPLTPQTWSRIPILTRPEAQDAGGALHCLSIPAAHGERSTSSTSGSSGRPLSVAKTDLHSLFWRSFLLREALWNKVDFRGKNAAIRTLRNVATRPGEGLRQPNWGAPFDTIFDTGPSVGFEIRRPITEQAAWLLREDPNYLLTFSSNLTLLAQHFRDSKNRPKRLRALFGFAEIVTQDMRELCREVFGVEIVDSYTAEEVGYMALQCPDRAPAAPPPDHPPALHVMAESVFLEILDEAGAPCAPGQVGRVVVTPLHNFAMPLLRYELGDFAESGVPCPCGRGLPVINRVIGRFRDSVRMPDGSARAAFFGSKSFYKIRAIRQFQAAQTALDTIEIRIVARQPLTEEEEAFVVARVRDDLDPGFKVRILYLNEIPRKPSGKSEDFRCEIV